MISSAATQRDLEIVILSEVSQREKNKYHVLSLIYGILKIVEMNYYLQNRNSHRCRKQTYGLPGEGGGEG